MESSLGKYEIMIMVLQSPPPLPLRLLLEVLIQRFVLVYVLNHLMTYRYTCNVMYSYNDDHRYVTALKCGY